MLGLHSYLNLLHVSFGVQDGVALPNTEKTLPFGGEVWILVYLQLITEIFA